MIQPTPLLEKFHPLSEKCQLFSFYIFNVHNIAPLFLRFSQIVHSSHIGDSKVIELAFHHNKTNEVSGSYYLHYFKRHSETATTDLISDTLCHSRSNLCDISQSAALSYRVYGTFEINIK